MKFSENRTIVGSNVNRIEEFVEKFYGAVKNSDGKNYSSVVAEFGLKRDGEYLCRFGKKSRGVTLVFDGDAEYALTAAIAYLKFGGKADVVTVAPDGIVARVPNLKKKPKPKKRDKLCKTVAVLDFKAGMSGFNVSPGCALSGGAVTRFDFLCSDAAGKAESGIKNLIADLRLRNTVATVKAEECSVTVTAEWFDEDEFERLVMEIAELTAESSERVETSIGYEPPVNDTCVMGAVLNNMKEYRQLCAVFEVKNYYPLFDGARSFYAVLGTDGSEAVFSLAADYLTAILSEE